MKKKNIYGDCTICGGRVDEQLVQKTCTWGGRLIAVADNVPAGVCNQCGERYYKATVLKRVESMLANRTKKATRHVRIPITDFAAAHAAFGI